MAVDAHMAGPLARQWRVPASTLLLVGSRDGFDSVGNPYPNHRTEITLERHDDRLEGSIQTMFRTEVKFVRDESARAEW